jgi:membrane-associated progesterone receptor component
MMEPTTHPTHEPKDDPFTAEELAQYDGSDDDKPVYVAIKGQIFDVSQKRDMYLPGKGYHIFAGKDGSRGLGMSSLKPEDAVSDYSTLDDKERKVLDDWVSTSTSRGRSITSLASRLASSLSE